MRHSAALAVSLPLTASLIAAAGVAYDARPPLAHTGGFGEPTCRQCHFDGPTEPKGVVSLGGVPDEYQPGSVYRLTVTIRDSTARKGGFQLAARVAAGSHAGTQAGTLCVTSTRVAVATDSTARVQYASHAGAARADSLEWQVDWRAPSTDVGGVIFHVAANSANDDGSMLGDAILLAVRETRPQKGVRSQGSGIRGCQVVGDRRGAHASPTTQSLTPPDP